MIKSNPIPFPDQYKSILENDFILRNISREYMNNVFNIIFDAQKIQNQVNKAEEKEAIAEFLEIYRLLFRQLHEHTMLVSQYQNGEISRKNFSQKSDTIVERYSEFLKEKSGINVVPIR